MTEIRLIAKDELPLVREIVYRTWPDTYGAILSAEQMEYMLETFHNLQYLEKSMENGHSFYILQENDVPLGFLAIQPNAELEALKIHKIYVLPESQGKRAGAKLIQKAREEAQKLGLKRLFLNVNRFNKAVSFYEAMGMTILKEEDVDIGNGYLMEDFVMGMDVG